MQDQAPRSGDEIDELFREVKLGNLQVLKAPYETYKAEFMNFCARYGANQFDVLDAYQDAFVALVENVQYGGVETLRSGLKTYLFSIGKYTLFRKLKQANKISELSPEIIEIEKEAIGFQIPDEPTEQQIQLQSALSQLGAKCQQLIKLFYYHRYSIEAIRHEMGYANENTVKAHKSRCMKNLISSIRANQ